MDERGGVSLGRVEWSRQTQSTRLPFLSNSNSRVPRQSSYGHNSSVQFSLLPLLLLL